MARVGRQRPVWSSVACSCDDMKVKEGRKGQSQHVALPHPSLCGLSIAVCSANSVVDPSPVFSVFFMPVFDACRKMLLYLEISMPACRKYEERRKPNTQAEEKRKEKEKEGRRRKGRKDNSWWHEAEEGRGCCCAASEEGRRKPSVLSQSPSPSEAWEGENNNKTISPLFKGVPCGKGWGK